MSEPQGLRSLLRELATRERHAPRDDIVRLAVRMRARDACEYCLMPTDAQFHVEPVIPPTLWAEYMAGKLRDEPERGRGGPDHVDNYVWICPFCDRARGQAVEAAVGRETHRLFDPRRDRWAQHFLVLEGTPFICGHSPIGRATEGTLGFNDPRPAGPLVARLEAAAAGLYPPRWARPWMTPAEPVAKSA
jgi:hypothetical protein